MKSRSSNMSKHIPMANQRQTLDRVLLIHSQCETVFAKLSPFLLSPGPTGSVSSRLGRFDFGPCLSVVLVIFDGAIPCTALKINKTTLKIVLNFIGSQWRSTTTGVMCE